MPTGTQLTEATRPQSANRILNLLALAILVLAALGSLNRGAAVIAAILAAGLILSAGRSGADSALRVAVFAFVLAISGVLKLPFGIWIGVLIAVVGATRQPRLRPDAGWLPPGTLTPAARWLALVTVVVSAVALTVWANATTEFAPSTEDLIDFARQMPLAVLLAGGFAFVIINAIAEEVAYRGLALDAASASLSPVGAVLAQAAAFGAAHIAGFPAGAVGVGLAAAYGAALGVLRLLTGGMRVPILVHIAADATILTLFITVLLPD